MKCFFSKNFHLINISPLLLPTLFLIIGILLYPMFSLFFIFALLSVSLFSILCPYSSLYKQLMICFVFIGIGSLLHHHELCFYDNFYSQLHNHHCTVTGTIIDKSQTTIHHQKTTVLTLLIKEIATNIPLKTGNKLMLFYTKSNNDVMVGDNVTFSDVVCKKPSSNDFARYQMKEQILATIFNPSPSLSITERPYWSLYRWLWNQKNRILFSLEQKLSSECFRFFSSLFLGNRAHIKEELEETNDQFKTWGISHFLARSGLHLVVFILIWQAIFCIIPIPFFIKQGIIVLLSCIYFALTWTSAPFSRSFCLFILNKICLLSRRSFNLLHYLFFVCILFLLYCPLYIFFLDFQLSFALTFALAWYNEVSFQQKNSSS
jgi:ComEC/Rec2-related protein